MDRTARVFINGTAYTLNYGMGVVWDLEDKYGTAANAISEVVKGGKDGFNATRWLAVKMANNGEMLRRQQGYENQDFLTEKDVQPTIAPGEYIPLQTAVVNVLQLGYAQEKEDPDKEYDMGLAELNEKK